jgi:hypothetical protein
MELLTWEQQVRVMKRAAELYDGSRTVARCWTEALDDAAERERDARAAAFFLSVTDGVAGFGHITEGKNRTA